MSFFFEKLKMDYEAGRFSHAYLLECCDVDDTLKQVKEFIKFVLKTPRLQEKVELNALTDILYLSGEDESVKVADIKNLIEKSSTRGFECDLKFNIISFADNMTEQAQNKLLKTLEEPNPGVHFFLITANPYALLPTVKSRCVILEEPKARASHSEAEKDALAFLLSCSKSSELLFSLKFANKHAKNLEAFLDALSVIVRDSMVLKVAEKNKTVLVYSDEEKARLMKIGNLALTSLTSSVLEAKKQLAGFVSVNVIIDLLALKIAEKKSVR